MFDYNPSTQDLYNYRKQSDESSLNILEYEIIEPSKLRPWSRKIPDIFATKKNEHENCECGKERFTGHRSEVHLHDHRLWERDNFFQIAKPAVLMTPSNLPVEFVSSGYKVQPFESVKLKIKITDSPTKEINAKFSSYFGIIDCPLFSTFEIQDEHHSTFNQKITVEDFNAKLQETKYIPQIYDGRKLEDIVTLEVTGEVSFKIRFPVTIERTKIPVLTQRKTEAIIDRVTVITKTYLRYPCLKRLIESIGQFYPGITVIVADDNPDSKFEQIRSSSTNVKQYKMPEKEGWFAGRALAQSQVRTQFYLWVDDDFVFSKETDLKYMVYVAESTGFDIIGGALDNHVRGGWAKEDFIDIRSGNDGYCFRRKRYRNFDLPGFEQECQVVDVIENFFLARTNTVGKIRFDPEFENKGHREFFIDAIGELRVAWCSKPLILHKNNCVPSENKEVYTSDRFGKNIKDFNSRIAEMWYQRSHIKCSSEVY
ncbi:Oidioi.mRNA.OKI2018_I69.XSR.g14585.t1.cds [Oikopleura dioica]|uniref:Oidioi.mRNA.OKI2018_I69.XSR.g14585.t1.cds n=1 Tax=Oikopleura dioica TaxID=34765 RepID=A0ABN7SF82_OIKDI|nr:Oidioi.mRNA.OKI2018_I69.XSR.g14585.t1.cds [Oikopleura dioica]